VIQGWQPYLESAGSRGKANSGIILALIAVQGLWEGEHSSDSLGPRFPGAPASRPQQPSANAWPSRPPTTSRVRAPPPTGHGGGSPALNRSTRRPLSGPPLGAPASCRPSGVSGWTQPSANHNRLAGVIQARGAAMSAALCPRRPPEWPPGSAGVSPAATQRESLAQPSTDQCPRACTAPNGASRSQPSSQPLNPASTFGSPAGSAGILPAQRRVQLDPSVSQPQPSGGFHPTPRSQETLAFGLRAGLSGSGAGWFVLTRDSGERALPLWDGP